MRMLTLTKRTLHHHHHHNSFLISFHATTATTRSFMQDPTLDDSFTCNSDDFNVTTTFPIKSRDIQPRAPSRRSTVHDMPMRLRPAILLFGDSLTEYGYDNNGWAGLLANAYSRRADVVNRGFSGYNTRWALDLVPKVFGYLNDPILFTTVWFGANDAALEGDPQHVSIDLYERNLSAMLRLLRTRLKNEHFPIILLTPPPVEERMWKKFMEREYPERLVNGEITRSNAQARAYGHAVTRVAASDPYCAVVDVWDLLEGECESRRGMYLLDGLHLNAEGNKKVFEGIMEQLVKYFPKVTPDTESPSMGMAMEEKIWTELVDLPTEK